MKNDESLTMEKIFQIAIVILVVNFTNIHSVQDLEKTDYIDCNLNNNGISVKRKVNTIYTSELIVIDLKGKKELHLFMSTYLC